jgi:hypothetical protein
MVLPLTAARSLGKIRDSWNGTGEPIFALIFKAQRWVWPGLTQRYDLQRPLLIQIDAPFAS